MVAGLGDLKMASVNVANQINFIYVVAVNTVCGAGGIYLAQFKGAGKAEGMRHAYRFKVIFSSLTALIYGALCWAAPEKMLGLMTIGNSVQAGIVAEGSRYLRLTSFTLLPTALSMSLGTAFRETGFPKVPLIISAAATLVNTAGNWALIYGNAGAPRLEVAGAAIATVIARFFELCIFLCYVYKNKPPFFVGFRSIHRIDRRLIKDILGKSLMIFVSEASWISSETILAALYNGRGGAEVVAGMAAGLTVANIFFLLFGGIWTAAAVIVGGNLGAGKLEEAKIKARWIQSGSAAAGCAAAVLGAALAAVLVPLVFSSLSETARGISLGLVYVIAAYLPVWCLLNAMFAISRAGGDAAMGMYTDLSVNTLLFVPGCFILALFTSLNPVAMFALLKTTDFLKLLVARHFLNKERWVRNLTLPAAGGPVKAPPCEKRG
jgi:Na+-driven multidrug efflux pump